MSENSIKTVTISSTAGENIYASFAEAVAANPDGIDRIIVQNGNQEITGFSVSDISVADKGGAISKSVVNTNTLAISNSSFTRVSTTGNQDGGAIYLAGYGDLTNLYFAENSAANRGGAISFAGNASGILDIAGTTFVLNSAATSGGAIRAAYGNLNISGSTFSGNIAKNGNGGAVLLESYYKHAPHTVADTLFDGNQAQGASGVGGALYIGTNQSGKMSLTTISGATFTGNIAESGNGGALYNNYGDVTLSGSSFLTASDTVYNNSLLTITGNMVFAGDVITSENGSTTVQDGKLTFVNSENITVSGFTVSGQVNLKFSGAAAVGFADQSFAELTSITVADRGYGVIATGVKDAENIAIHIPGLSGAALNTFSVNTSTNAGVVNSANGLFQALKYDSAAGKLYMARGVTLANGGDGTNSTYASYANALAADDTAIEYIVTTNGANAIDGFVASGNISSGMGGAIYSKLGSVTLSNSVISNNSATNAGGAYFGQSWTISGSTFSGNSAANDGGAIRGAYSPSQVGKVSNSLFDGNSAGTGGGAIRLYSDTAEISGSTFSNNTAVTDGGAILMDRDAKYENISITDTLFDGNSAANGGAIALTKTGGVTISGCTFATASDTIYNLGTVNFAGNITLNASLTGSGTYNVADDTNFTIGAGIDLNGVDFSNANIAVDGALFSGEAVTIATSIGGLGDYTIANGNPFLKLAVVDNNLVLKEVEAVISGDTEVASLTGNGANIISGGKITSVFFAEKTNSADVIATKVSGGEVANLVGGAYATDGTTTTVTSVELDINGEADVKERVYAGGYLYGVKDAGAAASAAQMTVGDVNVALSGGKASGNVFGGAHTRQYGNASVDSVVIAVTGGTHGRVYGGGWAEGNSVNSVAEATITISGGYVDYVYGGGANGEGYTTVGKSTITISDNAAVGTIFMSGRYGQSSVTGTVSLTFSGAEKAIDRLSGVSSAGIDNAASTVVELKTNLIADCIDFVDKFIINEGASLTANNDFYLGNRSDSGESEGATLFDIITDGVDQAWDVIAGITDFEHAQFAINGAIGEWSGNTMAVGGFTLQRDLTEKTVTLLA